MMSSFRQAFRRLNRCKGKHEWRKVTAYTDEAGDLIEVYRCQKCKRRRFLAADGVNKQAG